MSLQEAIDELDALLGAPDGSELKLTPEQVKRVFELQAIIAGR